MKERVTSSWKDKTNLGLLIPDSGREPPSAPGRDQSVGRGDRGVDARPARRALEVRRLGEVRVGRVGFSEAKCFSSLDEDFFTAVFRSISSAARRIGYLDGGGCLGGSNTAFQGFLKGSALNRRQCVASTG
jgi:hypothetical protein